MSQDSPSIFDPGLWDGRLLLATIRRSFDFTGRSRRMEVILYTIATLLAGAVIDFLIALLLPMVWAMVTSELLSIAFALPGFALFVRRVHDHGQPGWWVLLPIASFAAQLYRDVLRYRDPVDQLAAIFPWWLSPILFALFLFLAFRPGTNGANAYGENPRL